MVVGICGKSGCGKTTLAKQIMKLVKSKTMHLDIDKIGHKVLLIEDVKKKLIHAFGKNIVFENEINRKKLSEIVFDSRDAMKKLTDITWKYMQMEIDDFLIKNRNSIIILDWALLSTTKYFNMCDVKIFIDIPYEIRKQRVLQRDNISEKEFSLREKASIDFNKENFDYVLQSNDEETVKRMVKLLW